MCRLLRPHVPCGVLGWEGAERRGLGHPPGKLWPRAYPGLPEPLYTRQFTRLLAAIRRGGGDRELRRRLRDSYWALQWDGEPFATRLATERCDALCRVGAHLVENFKIVKAS